MPTGLPRSTLRRMAHFRPVRFGPNLAAARRMGFVSMRLAAVWYADVPNRCCKGVREGGEVLEEVAFDRGGFACSSVEPIVALSTSPPRADSGWTGCWKCAERVKCRRLRRPWRELAGLKPPRHRRQATRTSTMVVVADRSNRRGTHRRRIPNPVRQSSSHRRAPEVLPCSGTQVEK